jgi:2-polyprenyl-3-methyl-5-hydroxy-6-metoxy-1,4-benzoquinol methylase
VDYTKNEIWNTVWTRPYSRYERHHQVFWKLIKEKAFGKILDIACGSSSCWRDDNRHLHGFDFSPAAIDESRKNNLYGVYRIDKVPTHYYDGMEFDTIIAAGFINYYRDLKPFKRMLKRVSKKGSLIIITINVIKDFVDREWTETRINEEFKQLGQVQSTFYEKIGWFVEIVV